MKLHFLGTGAADWDINNPKAGDFRIFEHNSIAMVEIMCQTLAPYSDQFFVSHMARTLHTDHETLRKRLAPAGIVPAYDDMEVIL